MTNIVYGGIKPTAASTSRGPSVLKSAFAKSRWAVRSADAERQGRYERLAVPLVQTLDRKLSALETALSRFQWPADTSQGAPWSQARLTSPSGDDSPLAGRVAASLPTGQDVTRTYTYFSRGLDADADAGVDTDTDFSFSISQGGQTKTISVAALAGDTWGDILAATASAVNDSTLDVQAEVIEQPVAYRVLPTLGKTGSILALSVDPARSGQDVALGNGSGNLLLKLDMEATSTPAAPATLGRYSLTALSTAAPTTIVSDGFLPVETTTLTAGEHRLAWSLGPHAGTASVNVTSDMDWQDVLRATANAINGSTGLVRAEVVSTTVPTGLTGPLQPRMAEAVALSVSAADPKLGQRLGLSDENGMIAALGLNATAEPGADARLFVNGTDLTSATGHFRRDLGRLGLEVQDTFGEAIPLSVVEPMRALESGVLDIATAYNDLRAFLLANEDLLQPGLAATLRAPMAGNALGLEWLGVNEMTNKNVLMVDRTRFWTALGQNPDRAEALLAGANGLVPGLEAAAATLRAPNLADRLATPTLMADANAPWQGEFANDKAESLLDLVDNATESGQAWKRVLELGGTLLDTIDAKRRA